MADASVRVLGHPAYAVRMAGANQVFPCIGRLIECEIPHSGDGIGLRRCYHALDIQIVTNRWLRFALER